MFRTEQCQYKDNFSNGNCLAVRIDTLKKINKTIVGANIDIVEGWTFNLQGVEKS